MTLRRVSLSHGRTVEVWDEGSASGHALVLIPGVAGGKEIFARSLPALAAGRRVIAVDLHARALDAAAAELWEVLDTLGVSAADLLGQSFGAIVAVRATRMRPNAVRRLILVAPATVPSPRDAVPVLARWAFLGSALRVWPNAKRAAAVRWLQRRGGYVLEPSLDAEALEALFDRVKRAPIVPLVRRLAALRGHSWRRELEMGVPPALVIEGDREWKILPEEVRQALHARARVELLPGGHMPFLTNPSEFASLVRAFLDHS